ncbi:uncharacterized [Tachysurus ichikawai]
MSNYDILSRNNDITLLAVQGLCVGATQHARQESGEVTHKTRKRSKMESATETGFLPSLMSRRYFSVDSPAVPAERRCSNTSV